MASAVAFALVVTSFALADDAFASATLDASADHRVFDVAGGEVPFWANMVKYARFSISIMVGFAYMFGRPIAGLLQKPGTAAAAVAVALGGYAFFKYTIEHMLGLGDASTLG